MAEEYRTQFYDVYRREAEEYDKGFIKKYDEDLNTTLIFVSLSRCSQIHVLTRTTGWSVFCSSFGIHHPSSVGLQARSQ